MGRIGRGRYSEGEAPKPAIGLGLVDAADISITVKDAVLIQLCGARITAQRQGSQGLVLELAPQPVTVSNMHGQHLLESPQELAGALGVLAMALKITV
jgi:hypothetical protein